MIFCLTIAALLLQFLGVLALLTSARHAQDAARVVAPEAERGQAVNRTG